MWSKVKTILRSLKARSDKALQAAIHKALQAVTTEDAAGWFAPCGNRYRHTSNALFI